MRHLPIFFTAVLLSSSMLAATAGAQPDSESLRCTRVGQRLGLCETIGVSDSASGGALNLLSKDYMVVPIEQTAASVFPSHLVIGAADLNNAQIISLLQRSYRVGKTVAIVGATEEQADRFHRLLRPGEAGNCHLPKGRAISSLYGLQSSRDRYPSQNSSYCLVNLDRRHPHSDRRWLRERFGLTPPEPAAGKLTSTGKFTATSNATSTDDPNQFLTGLASATHCSTKTNLGDGAIQLDAFVYSMRNFTDTGCSSCKDVGADYYLVQDNASYTPYSSAVANFEVGDGGLLDTANNVGFTSGSYNLEFTDPATTTTYESSYTNSSSATSDGSVGVSADGPNVTSGGSVTTSQSMTYSVPATMILNNSVLPTASPQWIFTPQDLPLSSNFDVNPTWTWFIPRDAYPSGGTAMGGAVQFKNFGVLLSTLVNNNYNVLGSLEQVCNVPYPFNAWTVNPPLIQSITQPTSGSAGQYFTINGLYLYPSSVVAVLIDGTAVPQANFEVVAPQTTPPQPPAIVVTLPTNYASGNHTVQVNTQFNGDTVFSNNNVPLIVPNNP